MAYNTKAIMVDKNGQPIPQYFNQLADAYQPLQGEHGAARNILYGADGQPISVVDSKLAVRASEIETALAALIGEVQASPTANTLLARLKSLEDKIAAIDSVLDAIVDGSTPAVTQLSGSNMELYGASINDRPAANTVPAGATFTIVDRDLDKNWISDGTNWEEV